MVVRPETGTRTRTVENTPVAEEFVGKKVISLGQHVVGKVADPFSGPFVHIHRRPTGVAEEVTSARMG